MDNNTIDVVLDSIKKFVNQYEDTAVDKIAKEDSTSPFKVLISTLISSRTKDDVTHRASSRLFSKASTPTEMLKLTIKEIEQLIFPCGFYRNKAKFIIQTSKIILDEFEGKVPNKISDMVKLPGVGRKTANLVKGLAFNELAICVDTHVHRISNRLGYIKSKTPEETENQLRVKLPEEHWIPINGLLVSYGQKICVPINPHCSKCIVINFCKRVGVKKSR